ncbi:MAG: FAD-dependent oxidoreductase, partial [Pirellulaceae bacterium]|nr:FAD-dependent oxidoreductase [Pirellulaceae bacterium]
MRDYDYIIIGGGSAGCLLARRLVQANCGTVALIEAGDATANTEAANARADVRTVVPAYYPKTFGSHLDWAFSTEPQAGLNGRRIAWPRGKTLGGSGAINAMIYLQAAASDFDRWSLAGCRGWDWRTMEQFLLPIATAPSQCPLADLQIASLAEPHPWSLAFIHACTSLGMQQPANWWQARANTCGLYTLTQCAGRRQHTGQQLAEMLPNTNFDLFRGSTIRNLKLQGDRVEKVCLMDRSGHSIELRASGEVILCAGTIGSPTILLRSGIGPAAALHQLGVGVQLDLPGVGENLQDHLVYPLIYRTHAGHGLPAKFSVADRRRYRQPAPGATHGPLASNIAEAGAMFITSHARLQPGVSNAGEPVHSASVSPEFQIHFTPTHYLKYPSRTAPPDCFSLAVTDLHPRSRGRVQLVSSNPDASPRIDPGYLNHTEDIPRMLDAIEYCRHIANQTSLSILIADEILPSRKRITAASLLRSLQMFAQSIYHP